MFHNVIKQIKLNFGFGNILEANIQFKIVNTIIDASYNSSSEKLNDLNEIYKNFKSNLDKISILSIFANTNEIYRLENMKAFFKFWINRNIMLLY